MDDAYQKPADAVMAELHSGENGLSAAEAEQRLRKFGQNIPGQEKKVSAFRVLFRQFRSYIIYVLLFAAFLSLAIGDLKEAIAVSFIVIFTIFLSFIEEYKASKDMEALKKLSPRISRVVRDGKEAVSDAINLVVGDIIIINRGDVVPADCRIISSNNLKVDESILTGESVASTKSEAPLENASIVEQKNMLFTGTMVTSGHGKAIVVKTGIDTEIGKITQMLKPEHDLTPLQKNLDRMGKSFSMVIAVLCILILVIGIARAFLTDGALTGETLRHLLLLAVAVSVSGIPESLPPVIAIALTVGLKRMARQKAIIKRLPAVETLGSCTVICTDKTGTLTQNMMVVEKIFTLDAEMTVTGEGFTPHGLFMLEKEEVNPKKYSSVSKVIEIGVLCNNAELVKKGDGWHIEGESTEGALVVLANKAGIDKAEFSRSYPKLHEHPFDSERKCMTTIHMEGKKPVAYTKGAPEVVLAKSAYVLQGDRVVKITKAAIEEINMKIESFAQTGMRVLALAYADHKEGHVEKNLVFAGLVAMRDPPAKGVFESIKLCREAGTKVVMITGDNRLTALSIATELGIYTEEDDVITGEELDRLSDKEFHKRVNTITVYARTTPGHKLRIVEALQKKGHIVAMTGDGVNDAPALKKADIGVAMGKRGTEVAKESAQMIITDDHFSTIVAAIKEGRTIYTNIRKFVYYLVVGNFSEVILIFLAAVLGILPPLTPLMIIFINLVTSSIPALGLTLEKPHANIMKQKPRDPKERILDDYLLLKISLVMTLVVLGTLALFFWEIVVNKGDFQRAQTLAFVTLIFFELFHVFNAKSFRESILSRRLFDNPSLFFGVFASIILTLLVIYWPPLQALFNTVALSLSEWVIIITVTSLVLVFIEIIKAVINSEIMELQKEQPPKV
jgi:P-type Ca2+ transporter type 2C